MALACWRSRAVMISIRGLTVDAWIVADEAARLSNDLIAALRPMRARHPEARFAMLSTAWSRTDPFWMAWDSDDPSWIRLKATADHRPLRSGKQLQRAQFGQRSERLDRDQMQLALEDIETSLASRDVEEEEHQNGEADKPAVQRKKRRTNRGALPARLPHVHITLEPESTVCPCCHGAMHVIGKRTHSVSTRFRPSTR